MPCRAAQIGSWQLTCRSSQHRPLRRYWRSCPAQRQLSPGWTLTSPSTSCCRLVWQIHALAGISKVLSHQWPHAAGARAPPLPCLGRAVHPATRDSAGAVPPACAALGLLRCWAASTEGCCLQGSTLFGLASLLAPRLPVPPALWPLVALPLTAICTLRHVCAGLHLSWHGKPGSALPCMHTELKRLAYTWDLTVRLAAALCCQCSLC